MPNGKFVLKQIMKFHYITTMQVRSPTPPLRRSALLPVGELSQRVIVELGFHNGLLAISVGTLIRLRDSLAPYAAFAGTYADLIGTTAFNTVPTLLGYPIATYSQAAIVYFIVNATMKGPGNASDILPDLYEDRYISVQGIDRVLIPPASYLVAPPPPPIPPATPPPAPSPTSSGGTSSPPPTSEAPPPSSPPSGTGTSLSASLQVAAVSAVAVLWVACQ
eukprot:SM000136S00198  [mRNA]  locus=s136:335997:336932:- [translate_table: standard]